MASNIGKLVVSLTANTSSFNKGMRKASFRLRRFSRDAKRLSVTMLATSAAILAPLALSVKRFADYGDQVAKMARRTGLSTEAVSELGYAAEISGANIDSLEKGVKRMARTITDAESGLLTYVRAFDKLGLEAETLSKMTPEDAFMRIGRAIADLESPILRAASAQEIFGRAGTMLLPLFGAGADGLAKMRDRAVELGVSLGTVAAAQAERLTDALTDVKFALTGLSIAFAEQVAPKVEKFVLALSDTVAGVSDWIRENKTLIKVVAGVAAGIAALTGFAAALAASVWAVTAALAVLAAHPLVAVGIGIAALVAAGASALGIMSALSHETEITANEMYLLAVKADEEAAALAGAADAADDLADGLGDVAANAIDASAGLTQVGDSLTRALQGELAPIFRDPAGMILEAEVELEHLRARLDGLWERQEWARAGRGVLDPVLAEAAIAERARIIEDVAAQYAAVERQLRLGQAWVQRMYGIDPGGPGPGYDDAERGGGPRRRPRGGPAALERGTVGAYRAEVGQYYRRMERDAAITAKNTGKTNVILDKVLDKIEPPPVLKDFPLSP